MKMICPYKTCKHSFELDMDKIEYKGYHRFIYCPDCNNRIEIFKNVQVKHEGKVHMSKKERLKLRKEKESV